jgi:hypothetical protein
MDSSKTTEDDTIRDQAESGYVATRPRFTRVRRTWKANVRNLVAEDVRTLDEFYMVTTARGGNSFLYPNLLPNWSFEYAAIREGELVLGWSAGANAAQIAIQAVASPVADGVQALSFGTVAAASVPAHTTVTAQVIAGAVISCSAGEVYVFSGQINATPGTLAAGVMVPSVGVNFYDTNGNLLSTATGTFTVAAGWNQCGYQFTVPANAVSFQLYLNLALVNSTGSAIALDGSASVAFDEVGCSLFTPLTPYGRMIGSQSLGCLVRFSKLPENSDIGYGGGVKRYGASFELTEV